MLKIHHLDNSRSQSILWLLEELEVEYEIISYRRDPQNWSGPPEIKALHPIGKAPVMETDGRLVPESGAIVDHILLHHGKGRLQPHAGSPEHDQHRAWLYYAVSTGLFPINLKNYAGLSGGRGSDLDRIADRQLADVLSYIDDGLAGQDFLMGADFTAADIQVSFVADIAAGYADLSLYPRLTAWRADLHQRPAFLRSVARGGDYRLSRWKQGDGAP
ncbi:MAG: glutathione S-transferase family protein [Sphingobium sp.]